METEAARLGTATIFIAVSMVSRWSGSSWGSVRTMSRHGRIEATPSRLIMGAELYKLRSALTPLKQPRSAAKRHRTSVRGNRPRL